VPEVLILQVVDRVGGAEDLRRDVAVRVCPPVRQVADVVGEQDRREVLDRQVEDVPFDVLRALRVRDVRPEALLVLRVALEDEPDPERRQRVDGVRGR
jgi:hypothetical protein